MKSLFTFLVLFPIFTGTIMAQNVVNSRTAVLEPGGYTISGNAILEELSTGNVQLRLDDQFETPPGPDVRIYLSDAQQSISNAIEIADIGTDNGGLNHFSGGITFDVPEGITIDQYDYIVFRCVDFGLHWAHGDFGAIENNPTPTFECKESLTATTDWITEISVCTNDGQPDLIALKNNINEPVGEHYAFIITDENDAIVEVILADTLNVEGGGVGINRVYGVSYDGSLIYNMGDQYATITAESCAIVSSSETFLTIIKKHCKANISGKITHQNGSALSGFEVFLNNDNSVLTDTEGIFNFNNIPTDSSYTISPLENMDFSEGISTRDLVIIRKYILGIASFTNSIQHIAADVSNNGRVTTRDLLEIQRIILGIDQTFINNQSWRFVLAADLSTGEFDPFNFTESFMIDSLTSDTSEIDFIGVKIGDVSNAVNNGLLRQENTSQDILQFQINDVSLKAGEQISIPISAANFRNIEAFQFTINLEGLEFENIKSSSLLKNKLQFAHLDNETVTALWSSESALDTDQSIFTIDLRATKNIQLSQGLSFNSSITPAIAYTSTSQRMDIALKILSTPAYIENKSYELFQNVPNPFTNETTIPFYLNIGGEVTLNIYDISGKVISSRRADFAKGHHSIILDNLDDLPTGVLYYQLVSSGSKTTKKMIRL